MTETPLAAAAAEATGAKPRAKPMSLVEKTKLMQAIAEADPMEPDTWLAESLSDTFGRTITAVTVASYREAQGIASVAAPTMSEMRETLAAVAGQRDALQRRVIELEAAAAPSVGHASTGG